MNSEVKLSPITQLLLFIYPPPPHPPPQDSHIRKDRIARRTFKGWRSWGVQLQNAEPLRVQEIVFIMVFNVIKMCCFTIVTFRGEEKLKPGLQPFSGKKHFPRATQSFLYSSSFPEHLRSASERVVQWRTGCFGGCLGKPVITGIGRRRIQINHHHTSGPFWTPATSNRHGDALLFLTAWNSSHNKNPKKRLYLDAIVVLR